jgi:anti-anti-sigma factor
MTRTSHPLTRFRAPSPTWATSSAGRPGAVAPRGHFVLPPSEDSSANEHAADVSMEIWRDGPRPVVEVSGELDLSGKELLEAVLAHVRSTHPGVVAVDLGGVSFIDTHGLSPVLERDVDLVAASPAVRRMLRLLGLPVPRPVPARRWARRRSGRSPLAGNG